MTGQGAGEESAFEPRRLRDVARGVHWEPLMPALAAAGACGSGLLMHAALPGAVAVPAAFSGAALPAALASLAHWHGMSPLARAYAATTGAYAAGWASLAAAGAAHGPAGGLAVAGAGLLALPWWLRHQRTWTPKPRAARFAGTRKIRAGDLEPMTSAEALMSEWRKYVACGGGALPGTTLGDIAPVPFGVGADVILDRGKQSVSGVLAKAEMVASGLDKPPTQIVLEPHPSGRSSLARVTVLDRDVLADLHPYRGSRLEPDTGLAVIGKFFDGQDARVRFWEPGSGSVHWIIAGNTGNGKSTLVFLVVASVVDPGNPVPVVPFILDPEDGGQSTVHWQKTLRYAFDGEEKCIRALRGLDAIMAQRSADMAAEGLDYFDPSPGRPLIFVVVEEASALLSESSYKDEAKDIITRLGKRGRKRGIGMCPVTPVPSLEEIEGQTLRSMMRSGNVICFRTGDPVSGGMLGLHVDPQKLPKRFADGSRAYGLCYIVGPDDRQAPVRAENITGEQKHAIAAAAVEHPLDASSAAAFAAVWDAGGEQDGEQDGRPAARPAAPPAASAEPEDIEAMRRRNATAATAVLRLMADGQPRTRGDVLAGVRPVTTSPSTVGYALRTLAEGGLIASDGPRQPYVITDAGRRRLHELGEVA